MKHLIVFLCLILSATISVCVAGQHVYTPYGYIFPNFQPVPTSLGSVKGVPGIARAPVVNFRPVQPTSPVDDGAGDDDASGENLGASNPNAQDFRQNGRNGMKNSVITDPQRRRGK